MPLDRVKANELLELVVIDQSPKARELLLDKLEECVTPTDDLLRAAAIALRESARVHDAERLPFLVAPLIALAETLER